MPGVCYVGGRGVVLVFMAIVLAIAAIALVDQGPECYP